MSNRPTKTYTAVLTFGHSPVVGADQPTVKITFKSRGAHMSTVTSDARKAAEKQGYNGDDFNVFASGINEVA